MCLCKSVYFSICDWDDSLRLRLLQYETNYLFFMVSIFLHLLKVINMYYLCRKLCRNKRRIYVAHNYIIIVRIVLITTSLKMPFVMNTDKNNVIIQWKWNFPFTQSFRRIVVVPQFLKSALTFICFFYIGSSALRMREDSTSYASLYPLFLNYRFVWVCIHCSWTTGLFELVSTVPELQVY